VADRVAWNVIEPGWVVHDVAGEEIGHVHQVTGDHSADIFDGLVIGHGTLHRDKYVPAEHVGEIVEGAVTLSLSRQQIEALDDFTAPPPEEQILPESSTWYQRIAWKWLTGRKR
jgi:uncharacterized protein YrrD